MSNKEKAKMLRRQKGKEKHELNRKEIQGIERRKKYSYNVRKIEKLDSKHKIARKEFSERNK